MKKSLFILLAVALIACNKETKKPQPETANTEPLELHKGLYGFWVGDFVAIQSDDAQEYAPSNKINIVIKQILGNKVLGQSIVAGNSRKLEGSLVSVKDGGQYFELKEPGDAKNDGVFKFTIKNDTLSGKWFANDKNIAVQQREFKLAKQKFEYDPTLMLPEEIDYIDYYSMKTDTITETYEDGEEETYEAELYRAASDVIIKINSSTTKLTEEDLKNLKKLDLEILRNTIFARHGYTFKKKSFRQFFDPVEWYVPVSNDVTALLTPIEKGNIALLERFEKYAEDNYDSFGR
jgi:hypothetical protein